MSDMPPPPPPPNMAPPPGYVPYGGGMMSGQVQRIGGISRALTILVGILVPYQLWTALSTMKAVDKAKDVIAGRASLSEFESSANSVASSLGLLVVIPVAVLTMIWMFRMASNLRVLGRHRATWAPGWAIGGWFVPPLVLYVVPWLMFRELWKGSDPDIAPYDTEWKRSRVSPLVEVWWVLYGLLPIVGFVSAFATISNFASASQNLAEAYNDFGTLTIALAFIGVGTAVVYLLLVHQLSARHMRATREA